MKKRLCPLKSFTLIELMVVVTIIAILAALIVPALQRAQARAMAANCMGKAKAIAGSISTYASSWEGWTNPDSEYYVKLMGYLIDIPGSTGAYATNGYITGDGPGWASNSTTASYKYAQSQINAFRCPVDQSPLSTKHAVKTSYKLSSSFAGPNIMSMTGEANRTLMLREISKLHPVGLSGVNAHYVYADLHASLGYTGPALPLSWIRIWNLNSQGYATRPANSVGISGNPPYQDESYSGNWDFPTDAVRSRVWGLLGTSAANDWWLPTMHGNYSWMCGCGIGGSYRYPQNWLFRVDSLFKPPAPGNWQFNVYNRGTFSMGSGAADPFSAFDLTLSRSVYAVSGPGSWTDARCTITYNAMDPGLYYPVSLYQSGCCWSGGYYVRARLLDASGNPDPRFGGASGMALDSTVICKMP
jgi:prepilin-type N-terminal cleavage/methylation domain-containing protein